MEKNEPEVGIMRELLVGTEGHPDYLVIGDLQGLAVGIKPVMRPHTDKKIGPMLLIGVRIRVAQHSNTDTAIAVEPILQESLIPFQQINEVRGSILHIKAFPPTSPGVSEADVMKTLDSINYPKEMMEYYQTLFTLSHDVEDVQKFLLEGWAAEVTKLLNSMAVFSHMMKGASQADVLDQVLDSVSEDGQVQ